MPTCRICGDKKPLNIFMPQRAFFKLHPKPVLWCIPCQNLYIEMKIRERQEKMNEESEENQKAFIVSFE
jgi:hypothetical protein